MKKIIILFGLLFFSSTFVFSQSTTLSLGSVQAKVGDTVSVPINVSNLSNAGAISLKILYDNTKLSFVGIANSAVTFTSGATGGEVALGWFDQTAANPLSISSGKLVDLKFKVTGGDNSTTPLTFNTNASEIANSSGNPITVTYSNGSVNINVSPAPTLTIANVVSAPGKVAVPISVKDFNNIGAISLKISYSTTVLTFDSLSGAPGGVTFTSGASGGVITIGWFDQTGNTPLNLADGANLVKLNFTYAGSGTKSDITFNTSGSDLSDKNGTSITGVKYVNGGVSALQGSIPTLTISSVIVPPSANIAVPILAQKLKGIGAVSLKIQYNAALLTFTGVSNTAGNITFTANANAGVLSLGWFDQTGNTPINLDSTKLLDLNFSIATGTGNLSFLTNQCEVSDSIGQKISSVNYVNGSVQTLNLPESPVLISPANGAKISAKPLKLSWHKVSGAASYHLQVSSDNFVTMADDTTLTDTSAVIIYYKDKTTYSWRVSGINAAGEGSKSLAWNFTTDGVTEIDGLSNVIPDEYNLYQNYPNPFNPSTVIKYDLPKGAFISVKVYDILGREVLTLVNEYQKAGTYKITFDASNLTSGVYLYRIKANNFISVKKLVLMK